MESIKDASHHYEVERRALHAERPGFCISELQIGPTQSVPWHFHSAIQDTFYVIEGAIRLVLRDPKQEVRLGRGETYAVRARRPHLGPTAGRYQRPSSCCRASASTTTCRWCRRTLCMVGRQRLSESFEGQSAT